MILKSSVGASVEVRVLCEMIEPLARPIEAYADVVAAIVSDTPIRLTRIDLGALRPRFRLQPDFSRYSPGSHMGIDFIAIAVLLDDEMTFRIRGLLSGARGVNRFRYRS